MADTQVTTSTTAPTCMESVNRIAKFPVIESSLQAATNVYEKVKEYNGMTQWTCNTAETVVHKAVEVGKPIVQGLEGPIKKVDGVLCTGLDYVETKVPAVKLPPGELIYQMYTTTKDYVNNTVTPAVGAAYSYVEPAVKSAYEKIEPAVQTAKTAVEPAVEKAKILVEPAVEKAKSFVEPAVSAVESLKQYGSHKLEEIRQCTRGHPEGDLECEECQAAAKKMG
ncbi:lipid storage droplets surface-binding protein 1-like isoform X1 [Tribolium madens]|uniref:lipid storage droplets surface-binding protein 1-like isoform X1 n=1 Tax=Tribolium madens TaxID=41895 RepID=UPI001CF74426|nr:lipid storage droplets surface-binding protein 1-like isoform X1 [Tribolium madens]